MEASEYDCFGANSQKRETSSGVHPMGSDFFNFEYCSGLGYDSTFSRVKFPERTVPVGPSSLHSAMTAFRQLV